MKKNILSILIIVISIIIFTVSVIYIQYGASIKPELSIQIHELCNVKFGCNYYSLANIFIFVIIIPIFFLLYFRNNLSLTDKNDKNYFKVEGEKPKLLYKKIFYILCLIIIYVGAIAYYTYLVFGS